MNRKISSRLKMYTAVLEICKEHQTSWEGIPGFANSIDEFETVLLALKNDASRQESISNGVSMIKSEKLAVLFERLLLVHSALAIHAKSIGNSEVLLRNKKSLTDLNRLTITRLELHFDKVLSDLESYGSELETFGISEAMVQETIAMIEVGRLQSTRPRMSIIERHQLTLKLDESVAKLDDILKFNVDPLMRLFKSSFPEFFNLYFNARIVIDYRNKKADPESETGSPPVAEDPF